MSKHGISLMASEIKDEIKEIGGFCTNKFHANVMTSGIDYSALKEGDVIELSGDNFSFDEESGHLAGKKIVITKVGKPCFPDCPVPKEQKPCILNRNVAFAEEVK